MSSEQDFRCTGCVALRLLKHRELVRANTLVARNAGLQSPARKISTERPRKGSCAESSHRRFLPITIVNVPAVQRRLLCSRILKRLSNRPLPCSFRNIVGKRQQG